MKLNLDSKFNLLLFTSFFFLIITCKKSYPDISELRKLSMYELVEFEKNNLLSIDSSLFWSKGSQPTQEEFKKLKAGEMYYDVYVNINNDIKLLELRPSSYRDDITKILIKNARYEISDGINKIDLNCDSLELLLPDIYLFRTKLEVIQKQFIDSVYLASLERNDADFFRIILNTLETKCGLEKLEQDGINIFWNMVQHGHEEVMSYYFIELEKLAKSGKIQEKKLALTIDRLLMRYGYNQVYGSQILNSKLYPIRNLDSVNFRRSAIGMEPLNEYLKRFDLD